MLDPETRKMELWQGLEQLGLRPEDRLMFHLSYRSLGPRAGDAHGFLDALEAYFAPGLLMFPAHTWKNVHAGQPEFAVLRTPSCVGAIPEIFRKRPGVIRSAHPTHSLAAKGADAADLLAGQERFDTPCHPDSAYGLMPGIGAKILMVGVGLTSCTEIHCVEEVAKVPGRLTEEREKLFVTFPDGQRVACPQHRHFGYPSAQYDRADPPLRASGALRAGRLLDAPILLINADDLFDGVLEQLLQNIRIFDAKPAPSSSGTERET